MSAFLKIYLIGQPHQNTFLAIILTIIHIWSDTEVITLILGTHLQTAVIV